MRSLYLRENAELRQQRTADGVRTYQYHPTQDQGRNGAHSTSPSDISRAVKERRPGKSLTDLDWTSVKGMIGADPAHPYLAGQQICVRRPHLSVQARGNVVLCLHPAAQEQGRTGVLNHRSRFMGAPVVVINGSSIIIDYLSLCKQHYRFLIDIKTHQCNDFERDCFCTRQ